MSTAGWPYLPPDDLKREEEATLARELFVLLQSFQVTLASLSTGLTECLDLLTPTHSSTLPLSTPRSETLKGTITRTGAQISKASITLRLHSLPPAPYTLTVPISGAIHPLPALTTVLARLRDGLDIVDVSRWTGNSSDASFMSGQLRLLSENVMEARLALQGPDRVRERDEMLWLRESVPADVFEPPLPPGVSVQVFVVEAAIVLAVRTLQVVGAPPAESLTGLGFRDRLAGVLGTRGRPEHDEGEELFPWKGETVKVREKVRVDSQDPSLMAVLAKLAALEHKTMAERTALAVVMEEVD